ncbi:ribonuclease domain-containing protein [Burkholderia gladioli]|uniref:ribonuclease domain-containing protein n=1 Tax=Burkholderia gladioli TaxID=28095 RepID=UPI001FC8AC63|nr:ribonuclease domain-containing protein [Burkholderia gladioli]
MLAGVETLVGGGAAAALGFNAQGAATAAQNETLNNWLNHVTVLPGQKSEAQQATEAQAGCESGNAAACASAATLMQKSSLRDQALATACQSPGSVACAYQKSLAYLTGNTIQSEGGTTVAVETPQPTFTAPSPAAATLDNMLGSPLAGILGGLMYASGASPVDAYYASVIGQAAEGIAAGAAGLKMPPAPTNGSLASTSRATNTTSGTTPMINGVTVVDQRTGTVYQGTVDLQPTLDRIASGGAPLSKNDGTVFQNRPVNGVQLLPVEPNGYYTEYVVPTPSINGPGPQRIVTGKSGEIYYTPDHYQSFIPVKK